MEEADTRKQIFQQDDTGGDGEGDRVKQESNVGRLRCLVIVISSPSLSEGSGASLKAHLCKDTPLPTLI